MTETKQMSVITARKIPYRTTMPSMILAGMSMSQKRTGAV